MSRTSCKAVFHTDNKNLLNTSSSFYIPSQQNSASFSTNESLLKAEKKDHVTSTIKTSYKPSNYSQISDSKPIRETNSYKSCENSSAAISSVNPEVFVVKESINELSDCIAYSSDIPLAEKFARLKQQFFKNLNSEKENCSTDSEVSTTFEVSSSLDSTESDLNSMSSIPNHQMMLDRFRNGKPRKPSERSKLEAFSMKEQIENSNNISCNINDKKEIRDLKSRLQEVSINQLLQRSYLHKRLFDLKNRCKHANRNISSSLSYSKTFSNATSRPSLSIHQSANDEASSDIYPVRDTAAAGDGDILQRWRLKRKLENARTVAGERKISHVYNSSNPVVSQKPSTLTNEAQFSCCVLPYDVNHSKPTQLHSCCCKTREINPIVETTPSTGVVVSTQTGDSLLEDCCKVASNHSTDSLKNEKKILEEKDADATSIFESDDESDPFRDDSYISTEKEKRIEKRDVDLARKAIRKVVKKQLFDQTIDTSADQSQLTKVSDEVLRDDLLQTSSNHGAVSSIFVQIDESDNEFEDDEMMSNFRNHRNKILSRLRNLDGMTEAFD